MKSFLDKVAAKILENHPHPEKVCLVLPSRRAGVFLRKSFIKEARKTILMPSVYSMQDFVLERTGFRLADSITLTFELYEVHKKLMKDQSESFKDFLKYATTVLHDFSDIDLHLIEPGEVFDYLEKYSKLTVWEPGEKEKNTFQKKYLEFYKSLKDYYTLFNKRLHEKKIAYQGLAFRELAEQNNAYPLKWDKIYFLGFNFFTPSEEKMVDDLVNAGAGELIWDIDNFYFEDPAHEAGTSLRRLLKKWPAFREMRSDNLTGTQKLMKIIGAPGAVPQVKAAGDILRGFDEKDEVAVVLADESLLEPLINSVPGNISKFNITMGLALENTMLFSLFSALFRLHTAPYNFENAGNRNTATQFYFKDILRVLSHPAITNLFESRHQGFSQSENSPVRAIQQKDKAFYSIDDIRDLFSEMGVDSFDDYAFLWQDWEQETDAATTCFLRLLDVLLEYSEEHAGSNPLLKEYALRFRTIVQKIDHLQHDYGTLPDPDVFWRLFRQLTSREEVSFRGEPLQGIQVMGMLETRLLDFKNIIMLSVNEEFVPGNGGEVTFIPFEVRRHYKLPMKSEKAGIYAYHFYHLLQRAEKVWLLYNNHPEGVNSNEVSRFVKQIKYELAVKNPQLQISEDVVSASPDLSDDQDDIIVEKSPALLEKIKEKALSGFSATSLNKYRQCTLKFYFEDILGVSGQDEVEETIEARTLGNVVHRVLENIYKSEDGEYLISSDKIENWKKNLASELEKTFRSEYSQNAFNQGKNLLISQLAEHWLLNFLEQEQTFALKAAKNNITYRFKNTELSVETDKVLNEGQTVKLKGIIDRVDQVGDVDRIIDYKTGRVAPEKLKVQDMETFFARKDNKEAFQLLFYQWLYQQSDVYSGGKVGPAIISFPALREGVMGLRIPNSETQSLISEFEKHLFMLIGEILNEQTPFSKTPDKTMCRFCDFKNVCNRYS